jgi:hypothetical protein
MFLMPNEGWTAILGATVGALITYRFAVTLLDKQFRHLSAISKLNSWHVAAHEFVAAFADEIAALESNAERIGSVMDYLRGGYKAHAKAVAVFEQFVIESKRAGFKADWQKHCYGEQGVDWPVGEGNSGLSHEDLLFLHYDSDMNLANQSSASDKAAQRIKRLLEYAKDA